MAEINTNTKITRAQNLRAMQTLIIDMGGLKGYSAWLDAMPEGASLSSSGSVEQSVLMAIAEQDESYNKAVQTFRAVMTDVFATM